MFETIVFYFFATVLLLAALRVITARNPVHAALFLVLAFFTGAGIWLLLRAEFLALALVLVYVGAVMVLFLFVVMMLDINLERLREGFWHYLPLGAVVGVLMALEMALLLASRYAGFTGRPAELPPGVSNTKAARAPDLHRVRLRLRDRRGHPAGGDRRRDRAHAAPAQGQPAPRPGRAGPRAARRAGAARLDARGEGDQ